MRYFSTRWYTWVHECECSLWRWWSAVVVGSDPLHRRQPGGLFVSCPRSLWAIVSLLSAPHRVYKFSFTNCANHVQILARPSLCTSTSPRTNQCNVGYKSLHSVTLTLQGLTDRHRSLTDCTGRVGAITSTIPFYSHQALKLSSALWSKFLFGLRNIFSRQSLK